MKGLNKVGMIITKILEVSHWVGAALMIAATICSVAAPDLVGKFVSYEVNEQCITNLETYGFEISAPVIDGVIDKPVFILFGIGSVIILQLMAMVFRNLYLIFKKFENASPFQKDNARMMKEIGIFSISVPVIGCIMSIIIRLVTGLELVETSINMDGIIMGIIVLCLTQFFVYGNKLEKDVDGLL